MPNASATTKLGAGVMQQLPGCSIFDAQQFQPLSPQQMKAQSSLIPALSLGMLLSNRQEAVLGHTDKPMQAASAWLLL